MKRILSLLCALLLAGALTVCPVFGEDVAPLNDGKIADSLPIGGPAPFPPVTSAFGEDGLSYDDGTLAIQIHQEEAFGTTITYVDVRLTHPSQLRTALAAKFPSKTLRSVDKIAAENNAVLAVNGDYFIYHNQGVVVRNGDTLRFQPRAARDTLIIDENGDFTILTNTSKKTWEPWEGKAVQAFCFGPALMVDGVEQHFKAKDKVSCGANTKAQRLAVCQLGPLHYLLVAAEGPEQVKGTGLTIAELVELVKAKGAIQAYNLDGGSSVTVCLNGRRVNAPDTKNRAVGDIIYFATLRSE